MILGLVLTSNAFAVGRPMHEREISHYHSNYFAEMPGIYRGDFPLPRDEKGEVDMKKLNEMIRERDRLRALPIHHNQPLPQPGDTTADTDEGKWLLGFLGFGVVFSLMCVILHKPKKGKKCK